MEQHRHTHIDTILISEVHVLNPRTRKKGTQVELIENIRNVGLKRPIKVSRRPPGSGPYRYDLICGQGRLEAFLALDQTAIPAFVTETTQENCLLMSLVENVARPHHRPIDLMREIGQLRERGNLDADIAKKTGFTASWVQMVGSLLTRGEEKLLAAVERGIVPLYMAIQIARSSDVENQELLAKAYEDGFRGKRLTTLRRLLDGRSKTQSFIHLKPLGPADKKRKKLSPADLRRMFEREAEKQQILVKKAAFAQDRLFFATQALKSLWTNASFVQLLTAEGLATLPKLLADRVHAAPTP